MVNNPVTWIELNKSALDHNAAQYKKIVGQAVVAFVIKANAYGHGIREVAQLAEQNPSIDWLCVANLSEAITIHSLGITKPILTTSCIDLNPALAIHKNIEITIYNHEMAHHLNAVGAAYNYRFPIHIKIDTGLTRLGVSPDYALEFVKHLQTLAHLEIRGIYSHFSESSREEQDFTILQADRFTRVLTKLDEQKIFIPFKHMANTAGATALSLPLCNFVRIGAGLYGLWPSNYIKMVTQYKYPEFELKPILTWKARIINIKQVPANHPIGYERTLYTTRETIIANLPVGYSDGYDFRLHNKSSVLIGNHYAPIVGRVSMNLMTIDITDIPHTKLGDEVIIMGDYPRVNPYELGLLSGNLNVREINTRLNPTMPRIITVHENVVDHSRSTLGKPIKVSYT